MKEITNPVKAIRAKCLDCCCNNASEVSLCPSEQCALHPFRLGKNPYRKRTLSDAEKARRTEILLRARALQEEKELAEQE